MIRLGVNSMSTNAKKLYRVEATTNVAVYADNGEDAIKIAITKIDQENIVPIFYKSIDITKQHKHS